MTIHKEKFFWEKPRSNTLQNLILIAFELGWSPSKKFQGEERTVARQTVIKWIMKSLGCNKRTAYDYLLTLEFFAESPIPTKLKEIIIGGKKEHLTFLKKQEDSK